MRRASWEARSAGSSTLIAGLVLAALAISPVAAQQRAAPTPAVNVVAVGLREVTPQVTFTGRIEAVDTVELRARVEGFLEKRLFREGDEVKAGDLLFELERAPYEASVQEAEGALARSQGSLKLAELEEARQGQLLRTQAASQAKYDDSVAKLAEARGDVMRQQASLTRAKLNLDYTRVAAPIAGKIGRSTFSAGAFVGPSSGALATIVSQDPMAVTFPVTQRDLLGVQRRRAADAAAGTPDARSVTVRVRLADGTLYDQAGKVNFIDVQVNTSTDTVTVRANLANPGRLLVDGQLVTVVVDTDAPAPVLVVPQQAVLIDQAGRYVLTVDGANQAQITRITTGAEVDGLYVVVNGLKAGDRVIVDGIQKVRPGAAVEATEVPMPGTTAAKG